jgi:hypothetical protein
MWKVVRFIRLMHTRLFVRGYLQGNENGRVVTIGNYVTCVHYWSTRIPPLVKNPTTTNKYNEENKQKQTMSNNLAKSWWPVFSCFIFSLHSGCPYKLYCLCFQQFSWSYRSDFPLLLFSALFWLSDFIIGKTIRCYPIGCQDYPDHLWNLFMTPTVIINNAQTMHHSNI